MDKVNEKEIDGKIYTAYRDSKNPAKQFIECEGVFKKCRLIEVWKFNNKILALWQ